MSSSSERPKGKDDNDSKESKVIIVTGASAGIGHGIAKHLVQIGKKIFLKF